MASKSQGQILGKLENDKGKGKVKKYQSFWIFNGLAVTASKAEILEMAEEARVVVRIYMVNGQLIRTLDLGVKSPGFYVDR